MAMLRSTLRPIRAAVTSGLLLLPQGCFVYTEELLDSDVVSLGGGGAASGMPTQSKLKALPPAPRFVAEDVSSDPIDAGDAGAADADSDESTRAR